MIPNSVSTIETASLTESKIQEIEQEPEAPDVSEFDVLSLLLSEKASQISEHFSSLARNACLISKLNLEKNKQFIKSVKVCSESFGAILDHTMATKEKLKELKALSLKASELRLLVDNLLLNS